ncbi:hypothetical protein B0H13DRAFT_1850383 [Mycena leptocephala]|nr:hypothetical protein B0H13DRAFT_1850383 [Mycena leptocephala]
MLWAPVMQCYFKLRSIIWPALMVLRNSARECTKTYNKSVLDIDPNCLLKWGLSTHFSHIAAGLAHIWAAKSGELDENPDTIESARQKYSTPLSRMKSCQAPEVTTSVLRGFRARETYGALRLVTTKVGLASNPPGGGFYVYLCGRLVANNSDIPPIKVENLILVKTPPGLDRANELEWEFKEWKLMFESEVPYDASFLHIVFNQLEADVTESPNLDDPNFFSSINFEANRNPSCQKFPLDDVGLGLFEAGAEPFGSIGHRFLREN